VVAILADWHTLLVNLDALEVFEVQLIQIEIARPYVVNVAFCHVHE